MSTKSSTRANSELTGLKEKDCGGDVRAVVKLGFEESLPLTGSKELRLDGGSKVEGSKALREGRDNEEIDEADLLAEKENTVYICILLPFIRCLNCCTFAARIFFYLLFCFLDYV